MSELLASESVRIDAPVALVRSQFADVAHHERAAPHSGVEFEVLESRCDGCTYEQRTAIGPARTTQTMRLDDDGSGPLVNTVIDGFLRGGTITFRFSPEGDDATLVVAEVRAGVSRLLAPVLRAATGRSLRLALIEDKSDIERGNYPG